MSIQSLILIAGMHRSGTSVVTRLCNLLGADIGGDLMPATPDNPKGYWENQASFDVHAALFQTYGMAWNSLPSLPEDWLETEAAANAGGALGAILTGEFSGDLAVVKDAIATFLEDSNQRHRLDEVPRRVGDVIGGMRMLYLEPAAELTVEVEATSEVDSEEEVEPELTAEPEPNPEIEANAEADTEPETIAASSEDEPNSDELPTVEAEVLDPAPQVEQPLAAVIQSLDEVDALLADGRHG